MSFVLPKIKSAADAGKAMADILVAVAAGELTPGEAGDVARLLEGFGKILEVCELEQRLRALEERAAR